MQETTTTEPTHYLLIVNGNLPEIPELEKADTYSYHIKLEWGEKHYIILLNDLSQFIEALQVIMTLVEIRTARVTSMKLFNTPFCPSKPLE